MQPQKCHLSSALPLKFNLAPANLVRGADITISFMSITAFHICIFLAWKIKSKISFLVRSYPTSAMLIWTVTFLFLLLLLIFYFLPRNQHINLQFIHRWKERSKYWYSMIWLNYHKSWTKSQHLHFDCLQHWTKACTVLCQYYNPKYSSTSA